jgi:putative FmdB family regulatory protein
VPLYDYCCPQGHVFEQMATIAARAQQACPACGQVSDKIPSRVTLGGRADAGPSKEQMPQTWLIAGVTTSLLLGAPLVLAYRFEPSAMLETIRDERATFTVGSITVFIALMNAPDARREALASLTRIWSGGAPIPPSTVKAFHAQFGQYIHNIYGLTETTSPSHGVPYDATAPVDDASGALSVGVPVFNTVVRIVGDDGQDLPAGEVGEIVKAYVSLRPGQTATAEELIAFCRQQMAAYKYPRQVEFLDELPKTVSGKLLRRELRDRG